MRVPKITTARLRAVGLITNTLLLVLLPALWFLEVRVAGRPEYSWARSAVHVALIVCLSLSIGTPWWPVDTSSPNRIAPRPHEPK